MNKILNKLRSANKLRNIIIFLKLSLPVAAVFCMAFFLLRFLEGDKLNFATWTFLIAFSGSLLLMATVRFIYRERLNDTAKHIDSKYNAFNRMECALELSQQTDHPLKDSQHSEAAEFFTKSNFKLRKGSLLTYLLIIMIFSGYGLFSLISYGDFSIDQEQLKRIAKGEFLSDSIDDGEFIANDPTDDETTSTDSAEEEEKKFLTLLQIYTPDEESNVKIFDSVDWSAGVLTNGKINALSLTVYRNGTKIDDINLEYKNSPSDEVQNFEGVLEMEALEVEERDLISIHLTAKVQHGEDNELTLISQVHFIGILPLREEEEIDLNEDDGSMFLAGGQTNFMRRFLRQQMELNKAVTLLRISSQYPHSNIETNKELLKTILNDQTTLRNELNDFLKSDNSKIFNFSVLQSLKKAFEDMNKACSLITAEIEKSTSLENE